MIANRMGLRPCQRLRAILGEDLVEVDKQGLMGELRRPPALSLERLAEVLSLQAKTHVKLLLATNISATNN